jgi:hypothetical protein
MEGKGMEHTDMFNGQDEKYNPPWRQDYRLKDQKVWP